MSLLCRHHSKEGIGVERDVEIYLEFDRLILKLILHDDWGLPKHFKATLTGQIAFDLKIYIYW
jgi:hypothetical protein